MDRKSDITPQVAQATCGMRFRANVQMIMALFVGSICILFLFAMPAFAQSMPENAGAKSYGSGWECNVGYRLSGDGCAAVIMPENAFETKQSYGPGWECHHGFRRSDDIACVAVVVPEGGFLGPSGERWHCLRGYLKIDDMCQEITLPANAFLTNTSFGVGWDCKRGFETEGDLCVAIAVPPNAYLNASSYGKPWTCERGFFEQEGLCEPINIPVHAYFDDSTFSKGWKCERGYAASGTSCKAITIPSNAHLDRSGNRWECDKNFQKSKGLCVLAK